MNIETEILNIITKDILQDESIKIDPSSDLLTTATLDSMALMRLVAMIEGKYEIKIPPTDLVIENFLNVQAMEAYVKSRLA